MNIKITPTTLVASTTTAIFLVLYWFLILPQFKELAVAQHDLEQTIPSSTALKNQSTSADKRRADIAELKTKAQLLLPATDKQYDLSIQLEAAAKSSGVTLTGLALNPAELQIPKTSEAQEADAAASAGPKKLTLSLSATGSYAAIQQWVNSLTSLDRFIQLDQITLNADKTGTALTAQVTGFAYYLPGSTP